MLFRSKAWISGLRRAQAFRIHQWTVKDSAEWLANSVREANVAKKAAVNKGLTKKVLDEWEAKDQAQSVSIVRVEVGDGITFPQVGDTLSMHYRGTLADCAARAAQLR